MICKAATNGTYTLFIEYDDDPLNPRTDYDNFGKMFCWHRKYNLGDEHGFKEPSDFLTDLLNKPEYVKPVFDYIKQGRANGVKLEYDRSERAWKLLSYWDYFKKWYEEASYPPGLKSGNVPPEFLDAALQVLPESALLEILSEAPGMVILSLFLYAHSGITMNTSGFSCPWDSGQVGWIYADHDMILKEYGEVMEETVAKGKALLQAEVECYDLYLTGQCYGYRLFEGENEIDSCWGFLGRIDDMTEDLRGNLPDACRHLVDELDYCFDNTIAEYFWRRKRAG